MPVRPSKQARKHRVPHRREHARRHPLPRAREAHGGYEVSHAKARLPPLPPQVAQQVQGKARGERAREDGGREGDEARELRAERGAQGEREEGERGALRVADERDFGVPGGARDVVDEGGEVVGREIAYRPVCGAG